MDEGVFGMVVFFGFLGAVIIVPIWLKERTRQSAHQLISQALEKGQTLDPTLMRQLTEGVRQEGDKARKTLGSGIVLLALAGGFTAAAFVMDGFEPTGAAHNGMLIPAVILGALGGAFVLLAIVDYLTKKKDA
jgi:uncharacterized membrane protein YeaQ/YmgE (transglycosylase-associated protein family)